MNVFSGTHIKSIEMCRLQSRVRAPANRVAFVRWCAEPNWNGWKFMFTSCASEHPFTYLYTNLDINGNRFEISFNRVWNRLNWWRCDIKCSFVSIAMLIWSFTNPCDLQKTQTVQQLRIQKKLPVSRFGCNVPMYMWTLLQIHVTSTESRVRWIQWWIRDARASQEFFAFDSCVMICLNFLKFLFVSLKFHRH